MSKHLKIMIVSEDHEMKEMLSDFFANAGHQILKAASPREAIEILVSARGSIEVVIADSYSAVTLAQVSYFFDEGTKVINFTGDPTYQREAGFKEAGGYALVDKLEFAQLQKMIDILSGNR